MPLIHITLAGPAASPDTIYRLQRETTQLMQDLLGKSAALTVVAVAQLPAGAYSANGRALVVAASMQATITAGTNSAAEKAAFIAAATSLLVDVNGSGEAPVYVALHELPAENWGYDGQTQAARRALHASAEQIGGAA